MTNNVQAQRRGGAWLTSLGAAVSAFAIASSVGYAMLRNGYAAYYDSFGIRPEDVGQGRGEILSQAALGLLVLVGRAAADQTIRWILTGGGVILFVLVCLSPVFIDALGFRRAVSLGFSAAGLLFCLAILVVAPRCWNKLQNEAGRAGVLAVENGVLVELA